MKEIFPLKVINAFKGNILWDKPNLQRAFLKYFVPFRAHIDQFTLCFELAGQGVSFGSRELKSVAQVADLQNGHCGKGFSQDARYGRG